MALGAPVNSILCTVYIPPASSDTYHTSLMCYLSSLCSDYNKVVLVGDFNFPGVDWSTLTGQTAASNRFCEFMFDNNLSQLVSTPTHAGGNILDLVITDEDDLVRELRIHSPTESPFPSDHYLISFGISIVPQLDPTAGTPSVFDYSKADWAGLCNFLLDVDFSVCLEEDDVDVI